VGSPRRTGRGGAIGRTATGLYDFTEGGFGKSAHVRSYAWNVDKGPGAGRGEGRGGPVVKGLAGSLWGPPATTCLV
jgi:hypothetical protein